MTRIESLLRKEIGLDAASIGSSLIERAARLRMKALGLKSLEAYGDHLEKSREERTELVESVVVNETWFFRDRDSFTAFTEMVVREWLPRRAASPLRVLSIPCSSGEEPYSLSIALLDAGLAPGQFMVDAVDISARVLARAKRAIFGKNSFRGEDLSFRDRYFRSSREGYALDPRVCGCVHFVQDNLLSERFLGGAAPYDFVFCRNLLIYFDRPTQAKALAKLKQTLSPAGILFVGPAELPIFLDQGFESLELPMAFACRKAVAGGNRAHEEASSALPVARSAHPSGKSSRGGRTSPARAGLDQGTEAGSGGRAKTRGCGSIAKSRGNMRKLAKNGGSTAQAYYLLGLVRDAAGDPQAGDFYRKALYLDPGHFETLWHMALLSEKNGDVAGARAYKRRAERAQKKTAASS